MPKISEIKVSYRRSIQPKQFESAEASVLLTLLFDEKEAPDADEAISNALDKVINHVEGRITSIKPPASKPAATSAKTSAKPATAPVKSPLKPAAKPAATSAKPAAPGKPPAPGKASKPAAPGKPGKPAAPGKPAKPAAPGKPAAAAEPEQGAIVFTKGDAMAAIGATMTRLAAAGKTDGADLIDKIILGYLPDDKPPFSYNRIPDDSLGDFISDLQKLEA